MLQADSPLPTETVDGGEELVKREAREGAEQLLDRAGFLLIQVPKHGCLDVNLHTPRCASRPARELRAAS